ncbi:glutamate receptor ionotropic, kainate 2-like isoform X2 [Sitophilus oryzae]|uniref:Glutamate receptor ionotropic, kainate 2-like isoform X2 n=1 Tax=Sitophilus oryzae TaxID=7048 RepID=A0A6J2XLJ3_SITOR|nr:glutamate receptor ionotropic, kainate 2-like isoform X2 [Sitophilus oryzae]
MMEDVKYFIVLLFASSISPLKTQYRIGGLFNDVVHQVAFQVIINDLNNENLDSSFEFIPDPFNASYFNSLEARKGVCTLLERGVIGIFGPSSLHTSNYIQAICDQKEIPQVEIHYDSKIDRNKCVVNLHPHPNEIFQFFKHLIVSLGWDKVVVLFEDNESLLRVSPLLELNMEYGVDLIFKQLEKDSTGSYRQILNILKKMPEKNIILDCSINVLEEVLTQAQQVGIMTDDYYYILTNLDMGAINLEPFKYGGANITGARIFDPKSERVLEINDKILDILRIPEEDKEMWTMRLSTALLIDGIHLFYNVIKEMTSVQNEIRAESLDCRDFNSWKFGYTLANQIKGNDFHGAITGSIKFDVEGFRRDFNIELLELTEPGLIKVGEWNTMKKVLHIKRPHNEVVEEGTTTEPNLFNRTFKVITVLTDPYVMIKQLPDQLIGNDRYEGFGIDVIHELSLLLGFNYTILEQKDGVIGNLNRNTNQWNGAIREIMDGNADLAITDLTITSERETAVDFTMPFMNLGISILYRKPIPVPPSLFMFTSPFSTSVWVMLGVAYMLVSIAIFIMGRLSPSEWTSPFPCIEEPEYLINQFSIRNSLWFTIGGLLQQGSELAPTISIRTVSGVWWFFVLIMVASYTANLAAFLTVETLVTPFKNIDELARQTDISYGVKKNGATENFFRDSNVSSHRKIFNFLREHPEMNTKDNEEGVMRVENENYAFFMESTSVEYIVQRHCSLAQVGGLLDDKGYGIAMKKYSPYRNDLSTAVLKLQETGKLTQLKIKWWKEKRGGSTCSVSSESASAEALDLKNVGGVFLVLFLGAIFALIGSFLEMAASIYKRCKSSNLNFKEELRKELAFTLKFKTNVKEAPMKSISDTKSI